jgi:hypothetical protein
VGAVLGHGHGDSVAEAVVSAVHGAAVGVDFSRLIVETVVLFGIDMAIGVDAECFATCGVICGSGEAGGGIGADRSLGAGELVGRVVGEAGDEGAVAGVAAREEVAVTVGGLVDDGGA